MAIIEANGLARDFTSRKRTVHAVRGVDLTVEEGEIVGFLGPNGAGKTTTLRMLTTLLRPTAGTATVAGGGLLPDPGHGDRARRGPATRPGRRAPPDRLRPAGHRADAGRHQRQQPGHRGTARPGHRLPGRPGRDQAAGGAPAPPRPPP